MQKDTATSSGSRAEGAGEAKEKKAAVRGLLRDGTLVYAGSFVAVGALALKNAVDKVWNSFYSEMKKQDAYSVVDKTNGLWVDHGPLGVRARKHDLIYGHGNQHKTGAQLYEAFEEMDKTAKAYLASAEVGGAELGGVSFGHGAQQPWLKAIDRALHPEERRKLAADVEHAYTKAVDAINTHSAGVRKSWIGGTIDRYQHMRKGFNGKTVAFQAVASTGIVVAGLAVLKQNLTLRTALLDATQENNAGSKDR